MAGSTVVVILSVLYCLSEYTVLCHVLTIQRCIREEKDNPSITQILGLKHYLLLILIYYVDNCIIKDAIRYN